jgi:hypothetical protein
MGSTPPGGLFNAVACTVSAGEPTVNQDNKPHLGIRTAGLGDAFAYLYFPRPFALNATIISAKIKFYTFAMTTGTHTLTFQRLNQAWSASKVTWNTRPTNLIDGTKDVVKTGVLADKVEWEVDITDWLQTVSSGGAWQGVQIKSAESVARYIYSEINPAAAYRPRLEVTWVDPPATPTGLAPAGGRTVGLPKPVVRAIYFDVSGTSALQAIQVQINATDVWTSPTFDSGTVLTSVPELNLASTAYAGLADGSTTFWRVRLQDAAGQWSPWSSSTSFRYDTKGTLTLTNPPSGTPTVEDTTPPIIWTFTGETQSAYQIVITHVANGVEIRDWDSGKITSTAVSVTVPEGKILSPSTTYSVTVRIWDTELREATPGDTAYVEVTRSFTFVPGATTGTTTLTTIAQDPKPQVRIFWNRATSPDKFNVLRNGKIIATGLNPVDVFISGTSYTWTDDSPSPGRVLTYEVQAVVNNVASATNATSAVTVRSTGVWLKDPSSGLELCILGNDERSFVLGEQSAILQSIAFNAPKIAISQSLGGLEGRIEGKLADYASKTAEQWRDIYLQLRALRVKQFWLTTGDYTFLAVCQAWTYSQQTVPDPIYRVGFDFFQQDSIDSILGA